MDKKYRIGLILLFGGVTIYTAHVHKQNIHKMLGPHIEPYVVNNISEKEVRDATIKINHDAELKFAEFPNKLNLPEKYRYSQRSYDKYLSWINQTIQQSDSANDYALIIDKAAYEMSLYHDGTKMKEIPIELGLNPIDDKYMEGDGTTPEGMYSIKRIKNKGETSFYKAYLLNYPIDKDYEKLNKEKQNGNALKYATPGRLIEIHGEGHDEKNRINWTLGCISIKNEYMDQLFLSNIQENTPVTIVRYGTKKDYSHLQIQ